MIQEGDDMQVGKDLQKSVNKWFFLSVNDFEQGSDWCFRKIVFVICKSVSIL